MYHDFDVYQLRLSAEQMDAAYAAGSLLLLRAAPIDPDELVRDLSLSCGSQHAARLHGPFGGRKSTNVIRPTHGQILPIVSDEYTHHV